MYFVDANILIYNLTRSQYREPCEELIRAIAEGRSDGRTSAMILAEVWRLEYGRRLPGLGGVTAAYYEIFTPLLPVTEEVFERALSLDVPGMGPNDRLHAATCLEWDVSTIVSADAVFDGVRGIKRVNPLDRASMSRLLR